MKPHTLTLPNVINWYEFIPGVKQKKFKASAKCQPEKERGWLSLSCECIVSIPQHIQRQAWRSACDYRYSLSRALLMLNSASSFQNVSILCKVTFLHFNWLSFIFLEAWTGLLLIYSTRNRSLFIYICIILSIVLCVHVCVRARAHVRTCTSMCLSRSRKGNSNGQCWLSHFTQLSTTFLVT